MPSRIEPTSSQDIIHPTSVTRMLIADSERSTSPPLNQDSTRPTSIPFRNHNASPDLTRTKSTQSAEFTLESAIRATANDEFHQPPVDELVHLQRLFPDNLSPSARFSTLLKLRYPPFPAIHPFARYLKIDRFCIAVEGLRAGGLEGVLPL